MGIAYLMGLRSDYSQEVVAQFYATLYVDQDENEMHFTLGGKRFKISVHEFASLFKLRGSTTTNQFSSDLFRLHSEDELEVTKMRFMYDRAYGNINCGHTSGLTPYYKMLNLLFRYTLCPRGGDSDNISHRARNLLYQMAPGQPKFNVRHFLWNEIIICSHTSSSGCHYAPYIFMMVKHATKLDLKTDVVHEPYKTSKGKLAQSFRLGKHTTGIDARGRYPGVYAIDGPIDVGASSSQAPPTKSPYDPLPMEGASHSHGAPRGKRGKFNFLAKGLFACFNMLRKDAREREAIVGGWLKSFIGKRKIKRTWQLDLIFHTLRSMR
jgi:hypothetical protein